MGCDRPAAMAYHLRPGAVLIRSTLPGRPFSGSSLGAKADGLQLVRFEAFREALDRFRRSIFKGSAEMSGPLSLMSATRRSHGTKEWRPVTSRLLYLSNAPGRPDLNTGYWKPQITASCERKGIHNAIWMGGRS